MSIRFHPESEKELKESVYWYEYQRKGLGFEFLFCVDEAIEQIKNRPQMYPLVTEKTRRIVVKRFPFAIFYETNKSSIYILAIFHLRRNPKEWKNRKS